jgi:hypothetical protein
MNTSGLIVSSDTQLAGRTIKRLREGLKLRGFIAEAAHSEKEARARLETVAFDLLVADIDIAPDENSGVNDGDQRGIALLNWAAEKDRRMGLIAVSPFYNNSVAFALRSLGGKSALVVMGINYLDELIEIAKQCLRAGEAKARTNTVPRCLNVTINLSGTEGGDWRVERDGLGFLVHEEGPLRLEEGAFKAITLPLALMNAKALSEVPREVLERVGELIMHHIFLRNPDLYGALRGGLALVRDDYSKSNLCFRITKQETHILPLEAIASEKVPGFWGLKAPIYRRIAGYSVNRAPPFSLRTGNDREKVNCLIIDASVHGPVPGVSSSNGAVHTLGELPLAEYEAKTVTDVLTRAKEDDVGVQRVLCMSKQIVGANSFFKFVCNTLEADRWDLVHFIGHSLCDQNNDTGFLFFPGKGAMSPPECVAIAAFADHLRSTRLLYLSSCQSAMGSSLVALARCQVPAVLGFRWPVADDRATEFAVKLYRHLLGRAGYIAAGDLTDPLSFAEKVAEKRDPLSTYFSTRFTSEDKALLTGRGDKDFAAIERLLIDNLNSVLRGPLVFEERRFSGVNLRTETLGLLRRKPQGEDLVSLNRMLVEDYYPTDILRMADSPPSLQHAFARTRKAMFDAYPKENIWLSAILTLQYS